MSLAGMKPLKKGLRRLQIEFGTIQSVNSRSRHLVLGVLRMSLDIASSKKMPVTPAAIVLPNPPLFLSLFWRKLPPGALASDTIQPRQPTPALGGYVVVCRLKSSRIVLFELVLLTLCSVYGASDWYVLRCPAMRYCCVPRCTQRQRKKGSRCLVSRDTRGP